MPTHSNSRQDSFADSTTRRKRCTKYGEQSWTSEISVHSDDDDETLKIKEEIIEVEYDYDETLETKDEVIQDLETEEVIDRSFNTNYESNVCTGEISFHSDSQTKVLLEYDNDETLEIKDEVIQDLDTEEILSRSFNTKYESKKWTVDTKKDMVADNMKQPRQKKQPRPKKQRIQNLEKENKYKCEKCARSYKDKKHLTFHRKYECDVTPQFPCNFCGKLFKRKSHMKTHVGVMHLKSNLEASKQKYNCNFCAGSYSSVHTLYSHKRVVHAGVRRQYICHYCGHKVSKKIRLVTHINFRHLNQLSTPSLSP
ncbi:zinc finger protein 616-like [Belonocnema kinseyi]|uniref:zinc finger protein 616-like n=1 Tax=Belonocnema kinseyi TaxID=2817044 RepID=UPI00143DB3BA|nr:zinc finger protein 616-like [Belonocnema kinseyi]